MLANIWNATQLENFMPCNTEDCYSKLLMKYLQKRFIISLSWICIFCIFLVKKVNQVWLRSELYEGNWFIFGLPKWSKNKQNLKKIFIIWQKMCLALCESDRICISGPYLPAFGLKSLHIQTKCGKIRTRKTLNKETFHAVLPINELTAYQK